MKILSKLMLVIAVLALTAGAYWAGFRSREASEIAHGNKSMSWRDLWDTKPKKARTAKRSSSLISMPFALGVPTGTPAPAANPGGKSPDSTFDGKPPQPCETQWKDVVESDINELLFGLKNDDIELNEDCMGEESSRFPDAAMRHYAPRCRKLFSEMGARSFSVEENAQLKGCITSLTTYRARIIDEMTGRNTPPEELSGPVILNKLYSRLTDGVDNVENIDRMLALSDSLLQKEPDLYAGYKAKATLLMLKARATGTLPDENLMDESLESCADFDVKDPQIDEIRLLRYQMANDDDSLSREIDSLLERDPRSSVGYYHKAGMAFRAGRTREAADLLRRAARLAPSDKRIQETAERMKAAVPGEKIFQSTIELDLTDY